MIKIASLILCYALQIAAHAQDCKADTQRIEQFRSQLLTKEVDKLVSSMTFPIDAVIGGAVVKISRSAVFTNESVARSIFTEYFTTAVSKASVCQLAAILRIDDKTQRITSLVYPEPYPGDRRFARAGITSATALHDFLDEVLRLTLQKNYMELSKMFRYPFDVEVNGAARRIGSEADFRENAGSIVDARFRTLIEDLVAHRDFIVMTHGIMLNKEGDYWIYEVYGSLLLQPVGPFMRPPD